MYSTVEIMDMGLECLVEKMGIVNAEHFIAVIKRENFDYTAWQREYFDKMQPGQVRKEALEYSRNHPHKGSGERILPLVCLNELTAASISD